MNKIEYSGATNTEHSNPRCMFRHVFVRISNDGIYKMAAILVGFQIVGLSDFTSHSESSSFANQPLFDHAKSRLVGSSEPQ